jgi:hypothetical protein
VTLLESISDRIIPVYLADRATRATAIKRAAGNTLQLRLKSCPVPSDNFPNMPRGVRARMHDDTPLIDWSSPYSDIGIKTKETYRGPGHG